MAKHAITLLSFLLVGFLAYGQVTSGFHYQAVARDGSGALLANSTVNIRFQIHVGSPAGTNTYTETHAPTTNEFGLFSIIIGEGNAEIGDYTSIDWAENAHFLIVELNGAKIDTTQFQAVPYSHIATQMNLDDLQDVGSGATAGQVLKWDGAAWIPDADKTDDADDDPTNELQTLAISGSDITLSNGGGTIALPSGSPWIENGTEIYYNAGNVGIGVTDPLVDFHVGLNRDVLWGANNTSTGSKLYYDSSKGGLIGGRIANYDPTDSIDFYSIAWGFEPVAIGDYSAAFNSQSRARGGLSFVGGFRTESSTYIQTTFGRYNVRTGGSTNTWVDSEPLFVIGNGSSSANTNNALTLTKKGLLGLNEDTPSYLMDLENDDLASRSIFIDHNNGASGAATQYAVYVDLDKTNSASTTTVYGLYAVTTNTGGTAYGTYGWANTDAPTAAAAYGVRAIADNDNGSGVAYGLYASVFSSTSIGAEYTGYFSGDVYTTGTYLPSDEGLKTRITPSATVMDKLMQLKIKNYEYKQGEYAHMKLPSGTRTGFMAQDVAKHMPELVKLTTQPAITKEEIEGGATPGEQVDFQAVDYAGMVPYLVKALQEQQTQIEALKAEIATLKQK